MGDGWKVLIKPTHIIRKPTKSGMCWLRIELRRTLKDPRNPKVYWQQHPYCCYSKLHARSKISTLWRNGKHKSLISSPVLSLLCKLWALSDLRFLNYNRGARQCCFIALAIFLSEMKPMMRCSSSITLFGKIVELKLIIRCGSFIWFPCVHLFWICYLCEQPVSQQIQEANLSTTSYEASIIR